MARNLGRGRGTGKPVVVRRRSGAALIGFDQGRTGAVERHADFRFRLGPWQGRSSRVARGSRSAWRSIV